MKKCLFIMPYMKMGGVEMSLISLLRAIDYEQLQVDLLLLEKGGDMVERVPEQVTVYYSHYDNVWAQRALARSFQGKSMIDRIQLKSAKAWIKIQETRLGIYGYGLKHLVLPEVIARTQYDLVIDYHGYGYITTAIAARGIASMRRASWLHDQKMDFIERVYPYMNAMDFLVAVSPAVEQESRRQYPEFSEKLTTLMNLLDVSTIYRKAHEEPQIIKDKQQTHIVTVGRLAHQKGQDMAIEAAKILRNRYNQHGFKWHLVGGGLTKDQLETAIEAAGLQEQVILEGRQDNPYAYMAMADIYVQPSRHEGYGITLAEALLLGLPTIVTDVASMVEQLTQLKTGAIVPIDNPEALAGQLNQWISNPQIPAAMRKELKQHSYDPATTMNQFYQMLA